MRILFQLISWLALAATILPSVIYFLGGMRLDSVKWVMLLATPVWFISTPLWMDRGDKKRSKHP